MTSASGALVAGHDHTADTTPTTNRLKSIKTISAPVITLRFLIIELIVFRVMYVERSSCFQFSTPV